LLQISAVANPTPSRGAILIIDDEPAVAEMLRDIFTSSGYAVDGATNGGDALMLATLSRPDAVILDIKLPDTSGSEVLAKLRELDDSIAVVMLSGSDDEDLARSLLKSGAIDYIRKPFRVEQLTQAVDLAVDIGKSRPRRGVVLPFHIDRRRRALPAAEPDPLPLRLESHAVPLPRLS
jgi:DNA-binding response OmpR family regulator